MPFGWGKPRSPGSTRDPTDPSVPVDSPDQIVGRTDVVPGYRVARRLGRGSMGTAYLIESTGRDGRRYVFKRMEPQADGEGEGTDEARARYLQEVAALRAIEHPHVVRYVAATPADGPHVGLIMELAEGQPLRELLVAEGGLRVSDAVELVCRVGDGLIAAHALQIVHRDLKPENIMVEALGGGRLHPKIIDFGIARVRGEKKVAHTRPQLALGTPNYMAFEQLRALNIDHRVDVFALGCILYELLAGAPAFPCQYPTYFPQLLPDYRPPPLTAAARRARSLDLVPDELEDIARRAMARDRDQRFQNMTDLVEALISFLLGWDRRRVVELEPGLPALATSPRGFMHEPTLSDGRDARMAELAYETTGPRPAADGPPAAPRPATPVPVVHSPPPFAPPRALSPPAPTLDPSAVPRPLALEPTAPITIPDLQPPSMMPPAARPAAERSPSPLAAAPGYPLPAPPPPSAPAGLRGEEAPATPPGRPSPARSLASPGAAPAPVAASSSLFEGGPGAPATEPTLLAATPELDVPSLFDDPSPAPPRGDDDLRRTSVSLDAAAPEAAVPPHLDDLHRLAASAALEVAAPAEAPDALALDPAAPSLFDDPRQRITAPALDAAPSAAKSPSLFDDPRQRITAPALDAAPLDSAAPASLDDRRQRITAPALDAAPLDSAAPASLDDPRRRITASALDAAASEEASPSLFDDRRRLPTAPALRAAAPGDAGPALFDDRRRLPTGPAFDAAAPEDAAPSLFDDPPASAATALLDDPRSARRTDPALFDDLPGAEPSAALEDPRSTRRTEPARFDAPPASLAGPSPAALAPGAEAALPPQASAPNAWPSLAAWEAGLAPSTLLVEEGATPAESPLATRAAARTPPPMPPVPQAIEAAPPAFGEAAVTAPELPIAPPWTGGSAAPTEGLPPSLSQRFFQSPPSQAVADESSRDEWLRPPARSGRRREAVALAVGIGVVAAVAAVALLVPRREPPPRPLDPTGLPPVEVVRKQLQTQLAAERWQEALAEATRGLALAPGDQDFDRSRRLVEVELERGLLQRFLTAAASGEVDEAVRVHAQLSAAFLPAAAAAWSEVARAYGKAHLDRARSLQAAGRCPEAAAEATSVLAVDPTAADARVLLAACAPAPALASLRAAASPSPPPLAAAPSMLPAVAAAPSNPPTAAATPSNPPTAAATPSNKPAATASAPAAATDKATAAKPAPSGVASAGKADGPSTSAAAPGASGRSGGAPGELKDPGFDTPASLGPTLRDAYARYTSGDCAGAIRQSAAHLKREPTDRLAWRLFGLCGCATHRPSVVHRALRHLPLDSDRSPITSLCSLNHTPLP